MTDLHTAVAAAAADAIRDAVEVADAAARTAAVRLREVSEPAELAVVRNLFVRVWREDPADALTSALLRALAAAGSYVAGAWRDDTLVGACVGFFGRRDGWELHSHIAGVAAPARGSNVGFALKTHQRGWALARGVTSITWTFDPLVARNAYFNLGKLGAGVRAYLPNFYGPMSDGINAGDLTDRLLVDWRLLDPSAVRASAGQPVEVGPFEDHPGALSVALGSDAAGRPVVGRPRTATVLVSVPDDIESVRATDAGRAKEWRRAVRDVLGGLLDDGADVIGFSRSRGYVLRRGR